MAVLETHPAPKFFGSWRVVHHRGRSKLGDYYAPNGITFEGMVSMLDYCLANTGPNFGASTPTLDQFYVGLIDLQYFGFIDFRDQWADVTLPFSGSGFGLDWNPQNLDIGKNYLLDPINFPTAAVSGVITSEVATIYIPGQSAGSEDVKGLYITNASTLGSGNPGILWSTSILVTPISVNSGDTLTAQYTLATSWRV